MHDVLCLEHDPGPAAVIRDVLDELGYRVHLVATRREALAFGQGINPRLVIASLELDDPEPLPLLLQLLDRYPGATGIALSTDLVHTALILNARGQIRQILMKPIDEMDLFDLVEQTDPIGMLAPAR